VHNRESVKLKPEASIIEVGDLLVKAVNYPISVCSCIFPISDQGLTFQLSDVGLSISIECTLEKNGYARRAYPRAGLFR